MFTQVELDSQHPLSPTLFGLCIDKLEEVVNRVAIEDRLDAPKLMLQVILLLLYVEDVVLFLYDVDGYATFAWCIRSILPN